MLSLRGALGPQPLKADRRGVSSTLANYSELFGWWTAMISWSIAFLVMVSVYLYHKRRHVVTSGRQGLQSLLERFDFVWVLAGLLAIYIISIRLASSLIFVAGNVAVELLLITYIMRNKSAGG